MLLSLWKASLREWGSVWQCQKWHWLPLYRRERVTWSTGSSPDLSDSDVRKWFSDLKGNLISSGKPLRSKYLLHFLAAADYCWQSDSLKKSGSPWAPQGSLSFSGYPVAQGFGTNANPPFTQSGEEGSLINGCLRKMESICSGWYRL